MDGVKPWPRMVTAFRSDRSSLLAAWMLVTVFLAGNTVCFDLAQVHSWGFELRTLDARGADAATVFRAGLPALTLAVAAPCSSKGRAQRTASESRGAKTARLVAGR